MNNNFRFSISMTADMKYGTEHGKILIQILAKNSKEYICPYSTEAAPVLGKLSVFQWDLVCTIGNIL